MPIAPLLAPPAPPVLPPTQGVLSLALRALARSLPPSVVRKDREEAFAEAVYTAVEKGPLRGVDAAWGAVAAAKAAVFLREYRRNDRLPARERGLAAVGELRTAMEAARKEDLARIKVIRAILVARPAPTEEKKKLLETELQQLSLAGLPQTAQVHAPPPAAVRALEDAAVRWFGSPLAGSQAEQNLRQEIRENLAFFLILLELLGSRQEQGEFEDAPGEASQRRRRRGMNTPAPAPAPAEEAEEEALAS